MKSQPLDTLVQVPKGCIPLVGYPKKPSTMLNLNTDSRNFLDEREAAITIFKKKNKSTTKTRRLKKISEIRRKTKKLPLAKTLDVKTPIIKDSKKEIELFRKTDDIQMIAKEKLACERSSKVRYLLFTNLLGGNRSWGGYILYCVRTHICTGERALPPPEKALMTPLLLA